MFGPILHFPNPKTEAVLSQPFQKALENLHLNTVPSDPSRYNHSGLMQANRFLRAGGGYAQPWTRDASINSWNAASLLDPDVARDTLWSVTEMSDQGPIVQPDNQWWDKVIWIVGAWNHYQTTGDTKFLKTAYGVSTRLLQEMRQDHYSAKDGLFQGPSFFNDGIAGYPAPPAEADDHGSSFVLDHAGSERVMALSTNCLYVGAYRAAASMAKALHEPTKPWDEAANKLRKAIDRRFWLPEKGLYGYLIDPNGKLDSSEEGSGLAFSILFDIAGPARAKEILKKTHIEPFGITDVYPHFSRFSDDHPGRHNAIVWPMVEGMWARAATKARDAATFAHETENLARLSTMSGGGFFEIYNAKTGKVDGGWQNGHQWGSEHDQTWSATAYFSMIVNGLFGLRPSANGLKFEPLVPKDWEGASLSDLPYRGASLDIQLKGNGSKLQSLLLDGKKVRQLPGSLTGHHTVIVTVR